MRAKVNAPAATKSKFLNRYFDTTDTNYDEVSEKYSTSKKLASHIMDLYDSGKHIGIINSDTFAFKIYDYFYLLNH